MKIKVNKEPHTFAEHTTIQAVLHALQVSEKGIAVAINHAVIPKAQWVEYVLSENDNLLIIKATQGG